ncbi:hypothetical protein GSU68_03325 [Rathayibacter sp. VKM Ac-2759]|uniref:hypothetical protein n=1 Tax=Rathayibacter sp. VKM Ac-2759 TaxID=2609252 RepID=UPI00131969E3|nr:hypothetical protein [Rathayibacter sp. VKM Ac-2759]QHC65708.1 hypothetical protein GSU68_03325 [Rathayibacter sp. VKM Ac-2759]
MAESSETDPRYHAAYQRGYAGPEPERLTRAEERFRRPRRGESAESGEAAPETAAPRLPERRREVRVPDEPREEPPAVEPLLAEPPHEDEDEPDGARPAPASPAADTRVPLALAVMGALLLMIGAALFWIGTTAVYYDAATPAEQFVRNLVSFLPGPAITTGLLSIGAAIAVKAARS